MPIVSQDYTPQQITDSAVTRMRNMTRTVYNTVVNLQHSENHRLYGDFQTSFEGALFTFIFVPIIIC